VGRCLFLLVLVIGSSDPVVACTCVSSMSICEELRQRGTKNLFVGTVKAIQFNTREWVGTTVKVQEITFTIKDAMDSGLADKATIIELLGSCAHRFEVGETYLVDSGKAQGESWISACGYTMPVSHANELLRLVDLFRANPTGAYLFGSVKQYVEPRNFVSARNKPIPNALIRLETILELLPPGDLKRTFETTTDSNGWFQFTDLPPGDYTVTAELPAHYERLRTYSLRLDTNGCSQVDLRTSAATPAN
jgi:hypothetical protein